MYLRTAPDEPPQITDGSFVNSTSIQVSWEPLLEENLNGMLRNYIIRINDSVSQNMTTNDLSITIAGLDKYTLYEVQVSAVTVAEGPSASVLVRTDSDGKCMV